MKRADFNHVLNGLRQGNSLYAACQKCAVTSRDFYLFLAKNPHLKDDFLLALADYADQCTDEIRALTSDLKAGVMDNSTAKLLIETNKWLAQKACPDAFQGLESDDGTDGKVQEIVVKFVE